MLNAPPAGLLVTVKYSVRKRLTSWHNSSCTIFISCNLFGPTMPADSRPEAETPCAATGLLPSQKVAIATSWAIMGENPTENGVGLFVRLFKSYPNVQGHFAKLSTLPIEELKRSPVLLAHAQKALAAIGHLVGSLDEPGELVTSIQNLARDHQYRGVTSDDFKIVLSTLQAHLAHVLKDRYDDVTANAWKHCCDVIWSVVDAEMNKNSLII